MRVITAVADLRAALRGAPRPVALVPTMGALHDGHLALVRAARAEAATVVVSVFVNPAQFDDADDLAAYPRDLDTDARLAAEAGADLVFSPPPEEVYPPGFDTVVEVRGLTDVLEGDPSQRGAAHFRGVTTVVTKLFNMAAPELAFFGQKDAQQALVIRKLVKDLDFPTMIRVVPTVRDPDGLALSSRNVHLAPGERTRALAIARALVAAERTVATGTVDRDAVLAAARAELDQAEITPDYLELRSARDLSPAARVNGATLLAVAARVGRTRLIDNTVLEGPR